MIHRFRTTALALLAAALAVLAAPAQAKTTTSAGAILRFPSGAIPDANALAAALADPSVGTIIFEKGVNSFSSAITVFRRSGVTLCGATNKAGDTTIQTTGTVGVLLDECSDVTIRGLTIRSTASAGEAVRLQSVRSSSVEGFARNVTVRDCRLEGFVPLRGTVRAEGLDVADTTLDVTVAGGAGILWEDGPALLVTRTKFTCSATSFASAGVLVRGAQVAESEGDRARSIVLTRNTVQGDFATGFDLADVVDTRILRNRFTFSSATYAGDGGRVGIAIRRQAASALTEDYEIRSNRVRGAHTGIYLLNCDVGREESGKRLPAGRVIGNDLRGCGSPVADTRFTDTGCALRVARFGPNCEIVIDRNDLRGLQSPPSAPAAVVTPSGGGGDCFDEGVTNRTDAGRNLTQP